MLGIFMFLFLLPPLVAIRRVRPGRVFLRDLPGTRLRLLDRIRRDPLPLGSGLLLVAGSGALASWLAESWRRGFGFPLTAPCRCRTP